MAEKRPVPSLYEIGLHKVTEKCLSFGKDIFSLPAVVLFDVLFQLYKKNKLHLLGKEISNLKTFRILLNVSYRQIHLLQFVKVLCDQKIEICKDLVSEYKLGCLNMEDNPQAREIWFNLGLKLGGLFNDAGFYRESEEILLSSKELCLTREDEPQNWRRIIDCCHKLLHAQVEYQNLAKAMETFELVSEMAKKLTAAAGYGNTNHAALYSEFSNLFYERGEFDRAYKWSVKAMKHLAPSLQSRIIIDILCHASKVCVMKCKYQKAGLLSKQAVYFARKFYGDHHPKYSDALFAYGFYLLNFDCVLQSTEVYEKALGIRQAIYSEFNLKIATTHRDLAYAFYIRNYHSTQFSKSFELINEALIRIERLLPGDSLILADAISVKAVIMERIAIKGTCSSNAERYSLDESEKILLPAIQMAKTLLGEKNFKTAKYYSYLGRLYGYMGKYQAEKIFLKAIKIQEKIMGPEHFEVGKSVGYLAELYNYEMARYKDAEKLYLRSIDIKTKLFGESYSELDDDYCGLLIVYIKLDMRDKVSQYTDLLNHWEELEERKVMEQQQLQPVDLSESLDCVEDVKNAFFVQ